MGPWSKFEKRLRDLPDPALDMRFRFWAHRHDVIETPHPGAVACKLCIATGRRKLWSVPRGRHSDKQDDDIGFLGRCSPGRPAELSDEYLPSPRPHLIRGQANGSDRGLVDLLKACHRRLGRRPWPPLRQRLQEPSALRLLDRRAGHATPATPRLGPVGRDSTRLRDPN